MPSECPPSFANPQTALPNLYIQNFLEFSRLYRVGVRLPCNFYYCMTVQSTFFQHCSYSQLLGSLSTFVLMDSKNLSLRLITLGSSQQARFLIAPNRPNHVYSTYQEPIMALDVSIAHVRSEATYIFKTLSLPPLATLLPSGLQSTLKTYKCQFKYSYLL